MDIFFSKAFLAMSGMGILGYCIGSIPFGYLIARRKGINLFEEGSGNIGATNVGRLLGWRWFLLVFFLDFLKGAGPCLLGLWLIKSFVLGVAGSQADLALAAGVGSCLGHVYSLYLRFRGGKAVATAFGVLSVLSPLSAAVCIVLFLILFLGTRYVSIASIGGALALPFVYGFSLEWQVFSMPLLARFIFFVLLSLLVVVRHRRNLERLMHGTEKRISFSKRS